MSSIRLLRTTCCAVLLLAIAGASPSRRPERSPTASGSCVQGESSGGLSKDWVRTITRDIRLAEYRLSAAPEGGWSAPNRAHDLRGHFDRAGLRLTSRTRGEAAWRLDLRLAGFGRPGRVHAVPPVTPTAQGNRVEYRREALALSEWYVNDERGLEQGFDVARPPRAGADGQPLLLEMAFDEGVRARLEGAGRGVLFTTLSADPVLRYAALSVVDADGRTIPSCLALVDHRLQIRIDDRAARYPLRVDPMMTIPSWSIQGDQVNAHLGWSVSTAGDVNDDGYSDVLIGALLYDNGPGRTLGKAFLYSGSATGPGVAATWTATLDRDLSASGQGQLGALVAPAGDVNGDGFADILLGASDFTFDGQTGEGAVFVYHGGPSGGAGGASGLGPDGTASNADWHAESNQADALMGVAGGTAGDVNGDGYGDLIVGMPEYDTIADRAGEVLVWLGSAAGLGPNGTPANADWRAVMSQAGAKLGSSAATAGDVNGDGWADIIIGAPGWSNGEDGEGSAWLWLGSADGLGPDGTIFNADWHAEANQAAAALGASVATAGDVNGDGYSDVIVGAGTYSPPGGDRRGAAFAWHGGAAGLGDNGSPANADWTVNGTQDFAHLGCSVAPAGDLNGDGFADVVVGWEWYSNGEGEEGRATAYLGSGSGLGTTAFWSAESNRANAHMGAVVATAGDVNGDGFGDILVGAPNLTNPDMDEGGALLYLGAADGPESAAAWVAESNQQDAELGISVAGAGDVNGDGYSDVIVGAWRYDGGQAFEGKVFVYHGTALGLTMVAQWSAESNAPQARFGQSVASAGDVNNDGYGDILVGAPGYGISGGIAEEGAAFLWYGSASGLGPLGTPTNADWSARGGQAASGFGSSVASAGDVNGDGYGDIAIGSPLYDGGATDEGRVCVYHGSATGPSASADWLTESNRENTSLGACVASAGDVNGDGFSDLIVGADRYDGVGVDQGHAEVYLGSASGLSIFPAWSGSVNQGGAGFGNSVAAAGDVNGDGYSDVLVGASRYDGPEVDEGRVYLYLGSAGGIVEPAAWTAESNQAGARFGICVASAGDLNDDGYSDVVIGASQYLLSASAVGRVFAWYGSAADLGANGTPANADWSVYGPQAADEFGISVASAGDVTGDGFSDLVVGADRYADPSAFEGGAFLFYGNGGNGLDRAPLQFRTDNAGPTSLLGFSNSESAFRLKLRGRSAAGRGHVRLEWETKRFGVAFDDSGIHHATSKTLDTGAPTHEGSVVALNELDPSLAPGNLYHWRARARANSPYFPWSAWLTLPYNGWTEADIRTTNGVIAVPSSAAPITRLQLASMPNPFRSSITLSYALPRAGRVRLVILDVRGRRIAVPVDAVKPAGGHAAVWTGLDADGRPTASGVYFAMLESGAEKITRRIVRLAR